MSTDRQQYPFDAWQALGRAIHSSRTSQAITLARFAWDIASSGKSIHRLEQGRVYGDPATAPPGDYNSENYALKRLSLIERTLGWEKGHALSILTGSPARTRRK